MAVMYPNLYYNNVCYKSTAVYIYHIETQETNCLYFVKTSMAINNLNNLMK